jgi:hypothetical protein
MCPEEPDKNGIHSEFELYDEPEGVASYIEHHPSVSDNTGGRVVPFEVVEIFPDPLADFVMPRAQRLFGITVPAFLPAAPQA